MTDGVRVIIVQSADPRDLPLGGISTFIRGFVKYAPPDFSISMAGLTSDPLEKLGAPVAVRLEGRDVEFRPVARAATDRRGRIPVTVPFTLGLIRYGRRLPRPAVLQLHRPLFALPLLSWPGPRTRIVHLTTDQLRTMSGESRWRHAGGLLDLVERLAIPRMDRVYVVNPDATEQYRRRFPGLAGRLSFLPNWVDDEIFHPLAGDARDALRASIRAELGLDPRASLVLFAGRLEEQKDPALLIEAYARLDPTAGSSALLIAGGGTLREVAREQASGLGPSRPIHFLGILDRPALARVMQAADAFVITSRYELGPTVGLEALATGLPVVTTDVGLVAGLVRASGAGSVVPDRDPGRLAASISALLRSDPGPIRAAAAATVRTYRASTVLATTYADLRELAGHRRDGPG